MPDFQLTSAQAKDLAWYLLSRDADDGPPFAEPEAPTDGQRATLLAEHVTEAAERAKLSEQGAGAEWRAIGRALFDARGCVACHDLDPAAEEPRSEVRASSLAALVKRAEVLEAEAGCLGAHEGSGEGLRPRYGDALDREAVRAFLAEAATATAASPASDARRTIARFNCMACHERNGEGGLGGELLARMSENQEAAAAEALKPPRLTEVSQKLQREALRGVLVEHQRVRKWMSLQMPRFPAAQVGPLAGQWAQLEGRRPSEQRQSDGQEELIAAGRTLIGSRGFGCVKCHDMLGRPAVGTRGPDLALAGSRLHREWFEAWMIDPQRLEPGTRMPTVFLAGKSPMATILEGDPARQREAMWQYMLHAKELPAPEGSEPERIADTTVTRPVILRTFLPEVTPRSLALRFPGDLQAAVDVQQGRLAYAWSGKFLNLGPVWTGRGGNKAGVLGETYYRGPPGMPWQFGEEPAEWAARATDPTWGAELPHDGKVYESRVRFRGYKLHGDAAPEFRSEVQFDEGRRLAIAERYTLLRRGELLGVRRDVQATTAGASGRVWFLVARCDAAPTWHATDGATGVAGATGAAMPRGAIVESRNGEVTQWQVLEGDGWTWSVVEQGGQRWLSLESAEIPAGTTVRAGLTTWTGAAGREAVFQLETSGGRSK
jgi:mono/diheme cytochrome c family protein